MKLASLLTWLMAAVPALSLQDRPEWKDPKHIQLSDPAKGFTMSNPRPPKNEDDPWRQESEVDGFYSGSKSAALKHRSDGPVLFVFVSVKESDKTFGKDLQEIAENLLKNFEKDADNKPRKVKKIKSQEAKPSPIKGQRVWFFDIEVEAEGGGKFRAREWLFVDNRNQDHLVHLTCSLDDGKFKEHAAVIQAALGGFQTFKVKGR